MPVSISTWRDGKPFIATEEHVKGPWMGVRDGACFRCALCGHRFKTGDRVRWQFTNDVPGASGNPLVCERCDGTKEEIVAKMREGYAAVAGRYWFFARAEGRRV